MTRSELISQLDRTATDGTHRLRMKGADLANVDFSGLDLTGADLSRSNLSRANFENTILHGANLSYSSLRDANFENADLRGANLNFCALQGVSLSGANIEGISMSHTSMNSSAQNPRKSEPSEPLTLTTLLQKPGWGVVIGVVLTALLFYGFSGIIYFTNLILGAKDALMTGLYRFIVVLNFVEGTTVFLLTRLLFGWLTRRFRTTWKRHLMLSAITFLNYNIVSTVMYFGVGKAVLDQLANRPGYVSENAPWYIYAAANMLIANLIFYALQQGKQLTRKLSEQEIQLLNLEKMKTRAELDALQAKISPHFLYNALNSIASLVHEDPDKAEEMTMLLSKLFRYTTGRNGGYFTSLAEELEMVRTYLQVEQVRFGERLAFSVDVADPALNELRLPQFLLQPIVENSVKHGIAKSAGAGRIDVNIYREADWLFLSVHDSGPAFPNSMNAGYGLRSIQDKLKLLYGDEARVELTNSPYKQVLMAIQMTRIGNPLVEEEKKEGRERDKGGEVVKGKTSA